jgi:hypothetical protein
VSRVIFTAKAAPTTYRNQLEGGGTPVDASRPDYTYVAPSAALLTLGSVATADLALAGTSGTVVSTQLGSIVTQVGSVITTISTGTGSAQAQALKTLCATGTTDIAAILTAITAATTDAAAMTTAVALVGTDITTIGTDSTTLTALFGSIVASAGSLIATVGTNTGSAGAATALSLILTGQTEMAALAPLITNTQNDFTTYNTSIATAADVIVSVNTTNVTRVGQLKKAFDQIIGMANGGYGGLSK